MFLVSRKQQPKEGRMTKPGIFTAAMTLGMVMALGLSAGPAIARHAASSPAQSVYCATREPGNPYSKLCDYLAWSRWRQRGAWDSQLDDACYFNPQYKPAGCYWQ
jgi:hypothetical protein